MVQWFSSNPAFATISATGLVTGVAAGMVNVHAESGGVSSPNVSVTVVSPPVLVSIALSPSGAQTVPVGQTLQFSATGTYSDGSTQLLV